MNKKERETLRSKAIKMYVNSWTFEKMTLTEREKIVYLLRNVKLTETTTRAIYEHLHDVYISFLEALDYTPNWRDNDITQPVLKSLYLTFGELHDTEGVNNGR